MKRIITLSIVAAALIFAACKKDRECTCTITETTVQPPTTQNGNTTTTNILTTTQNITIEKVTKKQALGGLCSSGEGTKNNNTASTQTGPGFNQTTNSTETSTITQSCKLD